MPQIKYLEQIINANGRGPYPSEAEAIKKTYQPPKNMITQQVFLGFAKYYRMYVKLKNSIKQSTKKGGARGVMVIVVGNGHGGKSSNLGRDWLHFT